MTKQTFLYNDYIAITIIMVIRNQNLPIFNFSSLSQIFCYNDSGMEDNKINVAVVEDSSEDLANCLSLLEQYGKEKNIVFDIQTFESGGAFLLRFKSQFDFIILDINLASMNGIDLAKTIRTKDEEVTIMFATNLAKYATRGYEVDAVDFVLKPLTYASFYLRLERIMKKIKKKPEAFITTYESGTYQKINTNDILYIEVISHDIIIHKTNGEDAKTYGTLKTYEETLLKHWFIRCNSCYLVNARYIKQVEKLEIKLSNDEIIPISHPKRKSFMDTFKKYVLMEGR